MRGEMINEVALVFLSVIGLFFAFFAFMVAEQRDELKQQAVERGFAEWVVKSNGSTTWQWKEEAK